MSYIYSKGKCYFTCFTLHYIVWKSFNEKIYIFDYVIYKFIFNVKDNL